MDLATPARIGAVDLRFAAGAKDEKKLLALIDKLYAKSKLTVQDDRAKMLGALSEELVHGSPGGEIGKRPWGERSFYAEDPWGNPLCFVEAGTTYG